MVNELAHLLREKNLFLHNYNGISVCGVANQEKGIDLASSILYTIVDRRSVIYLSGGRTPKEFYVKLATEEKLIPGAVGMIDERYGPPGGEAGVKFHANSNEKMIRDSGFLRYLEMRDIPFYPILQSELNREETARSYDSKFRSLQSTFPKHIGILGIGMDGHTAGLPAGSHKSETENKKDTIFVEGIGNFPGPFKERITMTFLGLSMLDILLVMVFGEEKKPALKLVFSEGREEEIPGRFYKRPEIAQRTLLITDQEV